MMPQERHEITREVEGHGDNKVVWRKYAVRCPECQQMATEHGEYSTTIDGEEYAICTPCGRKLDAEQAPAGKKLCDKCDGMGGGWVPSYFGLRNWHHCPFCYMGYQSTTPMSDAKSGPPDYIPPEVGRPQPESPAEEYRRLKQEGIIGQYVPAPREGFVGGYGTVRDVKDQKTTKTSGGYVTVDESTGEPVRRLYDRPYIVRGTRRKLGYYDRPEDTTIAVFRTAKEADEFVAKNEAAYQQGENGFARLHVENWNE